MLRLRDRGQSEHHADGHEPHALSDDHRLDAPRLGTHGLANPDLLRALLHRVGHQAVDPDGREEERHAPDEPTGDQRITETALRSGDEGSGRTPGSDPRSIIPARSVFH